ncbi:hypothetical protein [Sulfurospirillum barnesii]|uniref:LPS export ABC transporter periplasmic protein LptC n=1 Tax=Sulfurospirillum barnesii (strain ATCC 700032 / DSM 10660 / SES-3) TaxID=760154 RepID=I3XVQ0_SULBS|nr:hypothetical protein [Sulfurospirillum barnesii]AFL68024.1 Protein of unknown function (DUF1239) [Sulfurospirillum barnesii SES-3]
MAVRILLYTTFLFGALMLFLIFKEPYTIRTIAQDGTLIPEIELFNAQNYQIKEGSIESVVQSQRVARYKDFDKLYTIHAGHKTKEGLRGLLRSDEGILKESVMHFKTNSHYIRDDGVSLEGEDIFYNLKSETLSSQKPFVFIQKQSKTLGDSFVYQMKEGTISATNIHSFIQNVGKK